MSLGHQQRLFEKVSGTLFIKGVCERVTFNELVSDPNNNKVNSCQHNYQFISLVYTFINYPNYFSIANGILIYKCRYI